MLMTCVGRITWAGSPRRCDCTRNASCNRRVHDHRDARHATPHSPKDTISGNQRDGDDMRRGGDVLRAVFPAPSDYFHPNTTTTIDHHSRRSSLNIWSLNRRSRHDSTREWNGTNPFSADYSGPSSFAFLGVAFRLGGRYDRDRRFSRRGEESGIYCGDGGGGDRGRRRHRQESL